MKALEGTWQVTRAIKAGKEVESPEGSHTLLTISRKRKYNNQ